ncbi:MAG: preprotein translocase subunit SecE [Caldicoprobacterales bacterium]|jgi:preprotein translocase subunit SecE|nr:preprotein translocase subunit SecE [Clostridiales bacterium]
MAKGKSAAKSAAKRNKPRKGIRKFFREVVSEVKKVSWPNAKDLTNHTIVVVVLILVFAALIGIVDFGLGKLFTLIS